MVLHGVDGKTGDCENEEEDDDDDRDRDVALDHRDGRGPGRAVEYIELVAVGRSWTAAID